MDDNLKPHQRAAVSAILDGLNHQSRLCVEMAVGTGKPQVVLGLIDAVARNQRVLVLTDRLSLANQLFSAISAEFEGKIESALVAENEHYKYEKISKEVPVVVSNIQRSLSIDELNSSYGLIIAVDLFIPKFNEERAKSTYGYFLKQLAIPVVLISSILTIKEVDDFGKPVFTLDVGDAVQNRLLLEVEYRTGPTVEYYGLVDSNYVLELLAPLTGAFSANFDRSALIVCRNTNEAALVYEALCSNPGIIKPILIHSDVDEVDQNIREFLGEDRRSVIAVTVNMLLVGVDIPHLTDVVLLRRFTSKALFDRTVSKVMQRYQDKTFGRVWDFANNQRYFSEGMGRLISDDRDIKSAMGEKPSFIEDNSTLVEENLANSPESTDDFDDELSGSETSYDSSSSGKIKEEPVSRVRQLANPCSDKPSKVDLLGRQGLVRILKGLIDRESRKHLIVALFGRWGSGKSSVIELLAESYKGSGNSRFIVFNAWQEEHSNNMTASIANKFIDDLYESKGLIGQALLSLKSRLINSRRSLFLEACISGVIAALGVAWVLSKAQSIEVFWAGATVSLPLIFAAIVPVIKSYCQHPFTGKIKELSKKPDFNMHIGLGHSIKEQLANLLQVYPTKLWECIRNKLQSQQKYIIVVDDLDRCSDKKILETLEAIQLIVDLEGVSVILAVDHQVLLEAVAARYKGQRGGLSDDEALRLARDFLGKILQITISLDKPSKASRERFIHTRLYNDIDRADDNENAFTPQVIERGATLKEIVPGDLLDFSDYDDDWDDDFDESDDYLIDSCFEFDFFSQCAAVFDVHNPRTLIRIHNAVTLLKGLYPDIADNESSLKHYIYLAYWFEVYSITSLENREIMEGQLFTTTSNNSDSVDQSTVLVRDEIGFNALSHQDLRQILYRVKNLSLPSLASINIVKEV